MGVSIEIMRRTSRYSEKLDNLPRVDAQPRERRERYTLQLNQTGFSLTELMIVVAIIGILALVAIPNFMRYQARAKQTEAKTNLVAIHTGEIAYFAENNTYIDDFNAIGFAVTGSSQRYYYELGKAKSGKLPPGCTASTLDQVSPTGFTAVAIGNIDGDPTCDVWTINEQKTLVNVINDVSQ